MKSLLSRVIGILLTFLPRARCLPTDRMLIFRAKILPTSSKDRLLRKKMKLQKSPHLTKDARVPHFFEALISQEENVNIRFVGRHLALGENVSKIPIILDTELMETNPLEAFHISLRSTYSQKMEPEGFDHLR